MLPPICCRRMDWFVMTLSKVELAWNEEEIVQAVFCSDCGTRVATEWIYRRWDRTGGLAREEMFMVKDARMEDIRPRCKVCHMPIRDRQDAPYTPEDDVDRDGLCQWCREEQARKEKV